jgi:hypothetical protein
MSMGMGQRYHLPHTPKVLKNCHYHGLGAGHTEDQCHDPHNRCRPGGLCTILPQHIGKVPRCPYAYLQSKEAEAMEQESWDHIQKTLHPFLPLPPIHLPLDRWRLSKESISSFLEREVKMSTALTRLLDQGTEKGERAVNPASHGGILCCTQREGARNSSSYPQ